RKEAMPLLKCPLLCEVPREQLLKTVQYASAKFEQDLKDAIDDSFECQTTGGVGRGMTKQRFKAAHLHLIARIESKDPRVQRLQNRPRASTSTKPKTPGSKDRSLSAAQPRDGAEGGGQVKTEGRVPGSKYRPSLAFQGLPGATAGRAVHVPVADITSGASVSFVGTEAGVPLKVTAKGLAVFDGTAASVSASASASASPAVPSAKRRHVPPLVYTSAPLAPTTMTKTSLTTMTPPYDPLSLPKVFVREANSRMGLSAEDVGEMEDSLTEEEDTDHDAVLGAAGGVGGPVDTDMIEHVHKIPVFEREAGTAIPSDAVQPVERERELGNKSSAVSPVSIAAGVRTAKPTVAGSVVEVGERDTAGWREAERVRRTAEASVSNRPSHWVSAPGGDTSYPFTTEIQLPIDRNSGLMPFPLVLHKCKCGYSGQGQCLATYPVHLRAKMMRSLRKLALETQGVRLVFAERHRTVVIAEEHSSICNLRMLFLTFLLDHFVDPAQVGPNRLQICSNAIDILAGMCDFRPCPQAQVAVGATFSKSPLELQTLLSRIPLRTLVEPSYDVYQHMLRGTQLTNRLYPDGSVRNGWRADALLYPPSGDLWAALQMRWMPAQKRSFSELVAADRQFIERWFCKKDTVSGVSVLQQPWESICVCMNMPRDRWTLAHGMRWKRGVPAAFLGVSRHTRRDGGTVVVGTNRARPDATHGRQREIDSDREAQTARLRDSVSFRYRERDSKAKTPQSALPGMPLSLPVSQRERETHDSQRGPRQRAVGREREVTREHKIPPHARERTFSEMLAQTVEAGEHRAYGDRNRVPNAAPVVSHARPAKAPGYPVLSLDGRQQQWEDQIAKDAALREGMKVAKQDADVTGRESESETEEEPVADHAVRVTVVQDRAGGRFVDFRVPIEALRPLLERLPEELMPPEALYELQRATLYGSKQRKE
ncbi:hypothetical protein KIPB_000694, partial [Kipferlia bialata]